MPDRNIVSKSLRLYLILRRNARVLTRKTSTYYFLLRREPRPLIQWAPLLFLAILSFTFFLGCSNISHSNKPAVTVWHWMTDRGPAFIELAKKYEQKTGIKVNFELYAPSDAYSQKIRAAAQGVNLPDIFGVLGEKRDFASFIKAGHILDLTPYMEADAAAWENSFFPKALAVNEFIPGNSYGITPGIFAVPIDMLTIQMVYNKKLVFQLGLDQDEPLKDLDQFLQIGPKIEAAGLEGLVSGWGEPWLIDCLANNYAFNIMGKDKVMETLKGNVPYTDPDWTKVLTVFKKMRDSGILAKGLVTMVNKTAEQIFANEKAVFAFNGSWCVNVYKGMNPGLEYGVMLPPQASDKYPMSVWGGAGSSFMVNARSKRRKDAVNFLSWLTEEDQQSYLSKATNNLPANKNCLGEIPQAIAQFVSGMDFATHPNFWGVSEFPLVTETLDRGIQLIIIGEKTPEQVGEEVQKVKERELAKIRNS